MKKPNWKEWVKRNPAKAQVRIAKRILRYYQSRIIEGVRENIRLYCKLQRDK